MASCFTKKEIKRYNLQGLSDQDQIRRVNDILKDKANTQRQLHMQAISVDNMLTEIRKHPKGIAAGLKAQLATDRWEQSATSGVEANIAAITAKYTSAMYNIMEEFMPRRFGLELKKKQQLELLKAIRGEQTSDPELADFARAWSQVAEELRLRFNKAGGNIKKLKDWGVPIHHDEFLVGKKGFDDWYNNIIGKLDLDAMGITVDSAKKQFKSVYDTIVTGGTTKIKPGVFSGNSKAANRHQEGRYFKFKDAESQAAYSEMYSDSTMYATMTDYVSMLSTEIGLMERFGPNPDLGIRTLSDYVNKESGNINAADSLNKVYKNISGKTNPVNRKFADRMQTIRNIETGLKLPGAFLSALPDVMFNSMTAHYNGLPGMRVVTKFIGKLNPNNKTDRELAARLHQPLQFMLDEAHSAMRFADVAGHKASARFASGIMRGSGLNAWTVAGKMAFHAEFMQTLKGEWNSNLKRTFRRYGITEGDQAKIKASTPYDKDGIKYFDPESVDEKLSQKIVAMVISETKYAVPEADSLVRSVMNQGSRRGEVGGEILRAVTMFKTFPATIIMNHWARALRGFEGNKASRTGYATAMLIGTWAIGATVYQLKEISKGRKPIDWDNAELWKEAALAGGAFSIIGDVVSSNNRDYGNSMADWLGGPIVSDAQKIIWKGVLGNLDDMRDAEKEVGNLPAEAVAGLADFVPGQFWYSKLIMERMFLDSMRKLGDPNYDLKKMQREKKHYEKFQNEKWY